MFKKIVIHQPELISTHPQSISDASQDAEGQRPPQPIHFAPMWQKNKASVAVQHHTTLQSNIFPLLKSSSILHLTSFFEVYLFLLLTFNALTFVFLLHYSMFGFGWLWCYKLVLCDHLTSWISKRSRSSFSALMLGTSMFVSPLVMALKWENLCH